MANAPKLSQEVNGFLDEANAARDPARTAWLAFLLLLTYVVVTLASVGHKDLLLNSPVRLPIINADIPLVGFFQYAPAMLLLVYLSLLVKRHVSPFVLLMGGGLYVVYLAALLWGRG
jgi:hypothetical protein